MPGKTAEVLVGSAECCGERDDEKTPTHEQSVQPQTGTFLRRDGTSGLAGLVEFSMMRGFVAVLVFLALGTTALAAGGGKTITAHGVRLAVPARWRQVTSAGDGPVVDPKTLLVVGTAGVHPRASQCQIAAYAIPPGGAVIVIVGWKTATSGGGHIKPSRAPLSGLRSVHRPSFECFNGRGAVAQVALGGRAYQVNVMVGDRATSNVVAQALAAARSFDLAR